MQAWAAPDVPTLAAGSSGHRVTLFDTRRRRLVPAGPANGTARMYVCGITPYDATHLGHANTYLAFDLLNRAWRDAGLAVEYVQNVTDVDDPLLERASATGVDWQTLAAEQIDLYRRDMTALRVLPPQQLVGAVESMELISSMIERLTERGAVYAVDDADHPDLYFAVRADAAFGSLAQLDEATAHTLFAERGGDPDRPGKKDPLDCLVWRLQRPGEPGWDSPFGWGRPGWHVECTAIAIDRLGTAFDVQGGGSDLVFPHHEMSAAEARVATDAEFASVYSHAGMVGLDGEKMSKSKGNLVFVSALRGNGIDPMVIRLALLAHHYRDDWMWTDAELVAAAARADRWRAAFRAPAGLDPGEVLVQVRAALRQDLDASTALAAVDAWASGSASLDGGDPEAPAQVAVLCDALLGIVL